MKLLIIADKQRLSESLLRAFRETFNCTVEQAADIQEGLRVCEHTGFDLIVLDLVVVSQECVSIVRSFRDKATTTPMLVLTAEDEKSLVIELLNAGADDCLKKPFDCRELLARSEALRRRGKSQTGRPLRIGELEVNTVEQSVKCGGRLIDLSPTEYWIVDYLAQRSNAVVLKSELLRHLYDFGWEQFCDVLDTYIAGIQRKLGYQGAKLIRLVPGQGYLLGDIYEDEDEQRTK